ncbi:Glucan endo-1-3-beta-glucosidase 3 [Striga hermonthica]|uniref:glucan endo-1,3-beta-D-glucosidase n=1 Tax=Striga hermonthica TaxID=68872 RepID=A0A9N7P2I7_STRHE|nr:Glucan endo-1-3-beta-glucosidase 3 [Striga hermonthica]
MGLVFLAVVLMLVSASADEAPFIGVNIGMSLSKLPSPAQVVSLLQAQQVTHVRLFDADGDMLRALANTSIRVAVSVPNEDLIAIGQSNTTAANWVARSILPYLPHTDISAICVGSEVPSALPNAGPILVPALQSIHAALVASGRGAHIFVSTPLPSSLILDAFPPSQAFFNRTWTPVLLPLLTFLQSTGSPLMLNVYPYYDYMRARGAIPLDYALFQPLLHSNEAMDPNTQLHYANVFDAVVDAAYFAMEYLNFTNIPILVTETGWPSSGGQDEPDATTENAATYNSNLIRHVLNGTGTPKHPRVGFGTYIYELYNEDLRPDPISEKNWGLFTGDGVPVYSLRLTGSGTVFANDTMNQTYCVARKGVDVKMLQAGLDWACGPGRVDCSLLKPGGPCYEPDTVVAHASYAFDAYYQRMGKGVGTCDFNGVAAITTTDPSYEPCVYPGSGGINGTFPNSTALAPSFNSTVSGCPSAFLCIVDLYIPSVVLVAVLWATVYL